MLCSHAQAWREMILNPQQGYGPGAYIRLASETSYYWSRSPTLVTMEPFANSYHAGYRPGGRWYWTHSKDMGLYTGLDTPPPFPLPHTHMYDNIRIISTIAFCVLLSSFSSFLAISRLRSLNKKHDDHHLLITYDTQRQKGKAWSIILHSITISLIVFDIPSIGWWESLASFPGLPRLQFWITCSMQKRSFSLRSCILQAIKNWRRGRPGNKARESNYHNYYPTKTIFGNHIIALPVHFPWCQIC